jgi:hypothetical protein
MGNSEDLKDESAGRRFQLLEYCGRGYKIKIELSINETLNPGEVVMCLEEAARLVRSAHIERLK